jgi:glutaredoxin
METPAEPPNTELLPVTVYWRPGCGFCSMLRRDLRASGLPFEERNIWDEPDAAAFVRAHARGNETVPTVTIGTETYVNPSADEVLEFASLTTRPDRSGRLTRWLRSE